MGTSWMMKTINSFGGVLMTSWKVSTDECSVKERARIWQRAMDKLYMPGYEFGCNENQFHGDISCVYTPMGVEFSVMSGSPLEISGKSDNQPYPFWMALLLEGEFSVKYQGTELLQRPALLSMHR